MAFTPEERAQRKREFMREYGKRESVKARIREQNKTSIRVAKKRRVEQWRLAGVNITYEEYERRLAEQNHRCAVCFREAKNFKRNLAVDHDHETGAVRGLLCGPCNSSLGLLQESPGIICLLLGYLLKHKDGKMEDIVLLAIGRAFAELAVQRELLLQESRKLTAAAKQINETIAEDMKGESE